MLHPAFTSIERTQYKMVKNQNWQKRVETADARRKEAKQRKQSKENKKLYKQFGGDFVTMLERNSDRLENIKTIDIWSDSPRINTDLFTLEDDELHHVRSGRRSRAASMDLNCRVESGKQGSTRGRNNSVTEKHNKKKLHPRRKESFNEEDQAPTKQLCKTHFFTNKCEHDNGKKGGKCKYVHYPPKYKTLCQCLSGSSKEELTLSQEAATSLGDLASLSGMGMVYHTLVSVDTRTDLTLHDQMTECLSREQMSLASLVYIVVDGTLVYDRNREGLIAEEDHDFLALVLGEDLLRNRKFSVASEHEQGSEEVLVSFPAAILEHILTFLPDAAVAASCRVCQPWHEEIGQHSAYLWRHLLERRQWPLPRSTADGPEGVVQADCHMFRTEFITHYSAIRDVTAIQTALEAIVMKKTVHEKEMTYQDFSTRTHAPSSPNNCVSVHVWSPNHLLAAYSQDCTLRLFASSPRGGGSQEKQCRELVCLSIDLYRHTRRKSCCIVSVEIDEDYICCLCHVDEQDLGLDSYNLVLLGRDDFVLSGRDDVTVLTGEDLNHQVIDIREAVLNYLLSVDYVEEKLLPLTRWLHVGGDYEDVFVFVSHVLAAYGNGRFMVEVSISIPDILHEFDNDDLTVVCRKLVLFSAEVGAILWLGDTKPSFDPAVLNAFEDMVISSLWGTGAESSDSLYSLAVWSVSSPIITLLQEDGRGQFQIDEKYLGPDQDILKKMILFDGWQYGSTVGPYVRPGLLTKSYLILGTVMVRVEQEEVKERKSLISFHPQHSICDESTFTTIEIHGDAEVLRMVCLRDQHVIIVCRTFVDAQEDTTTERQGGGHWFRTERPPSLGTKRIDVNAFIYHIGSRSLIGNFCLVENVSSNVNDIPLLSASADNTVGATLSWRGITMTGDDVRSTCGCKGTLGEPSSPPSSAGKKKRNGRAKRRAKKDEFARGMRQNSG